jgi:hypothetical protein
MIPQEDAACSGKIPHRTRAEARQHKLSIMFNKRKHKISKRPLDVYRCDYCGWFHVGRRRKHRKPR